MFTSFSGNFCCTTPPFYLTFCGIFGSKLAVSLNSLSYFNGWIAWGGDINVIDSVTLSVWMPNSNVSGLLLSCCNCYLRMPSFIPSSNASFRFFNICSSICFYDIFGSTDFFYSSYFRSSSISFSLSLSYSSSDFIFWLMTFFSCSCLWFIWRFLRRNSFEFFWSSSTRWIKF